MIHIVSIFPYIHKLVRGRIENDDFYPLYTTYKLDNIAVQLSAYCKAREKVYQTYGILGREAAKFQVDACFKGIEMEKQNEVQVTLLDEDDFYHTFKEGSVSIGEDEGMLYQSIVSSYMHLEDVLVFCEENDIYSRKLMRKLYRDFKHRCTLSIAITHPKYLTIYDGCPCSVLLQDGNALEAYGLIIKNDVDSLIRFGKEYLLSLARIVIINVHSNELLLFLNGEVYKVTHSVKDAKDGYYPAALASGVLACYEASGDVKYLLKELIACSVGASLSNGMYVTHEKVIAMIKTKCKIIKL